MVSFPAPGRLSYILTLTVVILPPDVGAVVPFPYKLLEETEPAAAEVAYVAVSPSKAFASFVQFELGSLGVKP